MKWIVTSLLLCLASCVPEADTSLKTEKPPSVDEGRVQITRIGLFEDSLAYRNRRGIYLVRDTKTGDEFIGISGIGITEVGSHSEQNGDDTTEEDDER